MGMSVMDRSVLLRGKHRGPVVGAEMGDGLCVTGMDGGFCRQHMKVEREDKGKKKLDGESRRPHPDPEPTQIRPTAHSPPHTPLNSHSGRHYSRLSDTGQTQPESDKRVVRTPAPIIAFISPKRVRF